ncbi:hypothetical protein AN963_10240 [Brevibacillus choshinensis]|uniref:Uncharacterized protein n=1 Tax=Brevibacillus choshinensis TaxID=54911 RepID=A0ABR5NER1_BRECH|nr:hypothetical protein [Brevibacillus choshinensis]KQL50023.1 hypothetical protein AN963_10240 [Brevibacillus choshinensis]
MLSHEEVKVYYIGYCIHFFQKEQVVAWADSMIVKLDLTEIPQQLFDLSMVRRAEDIPNILLGMSYETDEENALRHVVGIIAESYFSGVLTMEDVCNYLYRLSNYVGHDHEWHSYLYGLTGDYELALEGIFPGLEQYQKNIEIFLRENIANE